MLKIVFAFATKNNWLFQMAHIDCLVVRTSHSSQNSFARPRVSAASISLRIWVLGARERRERMRRRARARERERIRVGIVCRRTRLRGGQRKSLLNSDLNVLSVSAPRAWPACTKARQSSSSWSGWTTKMALRLDPLRPASSSSACATPIRWTPPLANCSTVSFCICTHKVVPPISVKMM